MWLDEIASAAILTGLDPDGAADVIAVRWIGRNAVKVAYRVNGASRSRLLARSNEALLSTTAPKEKQLTLDEDCASFRLASAAFPNGLAHPFDFNLAGTRRAERAHRTKLRPYAAR